jgi:hypothetical protein
MSKTIAVKADELRIAFEFVSAAPPFEHGAYICRDTAKIYYQSSAGDFDEEQDTPDDLETSDRYIAVPHKNDLGLGRDLVLAFVNRHFPADEQTVAGFFRRRGAYGHFKQFLATRGALQRWYDFEERATEEAFHAWCKDNGIEPVEQLGN